MSSQQIAQQIQHIASQDNVIGVVVSDPNGLCMGSHGNLLSASSAHVQSLLEVASRLSEEGEHPVIHIQASSTDYLISHTDGFTTAVARNSNFKEEFQAAQQADNPQQQEQPAAAEAPQQ